jgi:ArsR family metal-binding transcriptional regulator
MKITVNENDDVMLLVRMIESHQVSMQAAKDRNESREVMNSLLYILRDMQAQLSDLTIEAIRHEVRV